MTASFGFGVLFILIVALSAFKGCALTFSAQEPQKYYFIKKWSTGEV